MKRMFLILIVTFLFSTTHASANSKLKILMILDTAAYPFSNLSAINSSSFIGGSINNFLANLDNVAPGYVLSRVYGLDGRRLATRLNVYYKNGIAFTLVVKNTQHVQQFNADSEWDINLFRQENISRIELHNGGNCYSGCL